MNKTLIGAIEQCNLPKLAIKGLHIRVDTGAATSSLHVDNIEEFVVDEVLWVSFDIHPDVHDVKRVFRRKAKVVSRKIVKSSTATKERRYVITTPLVMANDTWEIQLTLTDRSSMTYLMLLGREAMQGRFVVDPSVEYVLGKFITEEREEN